MITLTQVNQYVKTNNIDDNTDIFSILSQMQLEYKENTSKRGRILNSRPLGFV